MEMLIEILNQAYSPKGYSFSKVVTIPWINQKVEATVVVTAKSPSKFTLTTRKDGGLVTFENGPQIHIARIMTTTLKGIDFNKDRVIFQLTGCPDITYDLKGL